jgi:ADP-ribose 1''-phosphate phosphatase
MADKFVLSGTKTAIRDLPSNSFVVHATNCLATWGAGVAAELATIFPAACERYKEFCNAAKATPTARWPPRTLAGRCLVIPPQKADTDAGAPSIYVVCLFTSYGFGRPNPSTGKPGKDGPPKILAQTREALGSFRQQLGEMAELESEERVVIYSPMFNSGAFGVAWERTEALIEDTFKGWKGSWIVLAPPDSS